MLARVLFSLGGWILVVDTVRRYFLVRRYRGSYFYIVVRYGIVVAFYFDVFYIEYWFRRVMFLGNYGCISLDVLFVFCFLCSGWCRSYVIFVIFILIGIAYRRDESLAAYGVGIFI